MTHHEDPTSHDHDEMSCLTALEVFYAYLDGELDDPRMIANLEHHLAHCRSCFTRAEMEGLLNKRLKELRRHRAPDRLKNRLRDLMAKF